MLCPQPFEDSTVAVRKPIAMKRHDLPGHSHTAVGSFAAE